MARMAIGVLVTCMLPTFTIGGIIKQPVSYEQGGTKLQGWIVYDDSTTAKRPGVVVFPEWWGLTDYPKHRAEQLAQLGYVAFAADMYGAGVTTSDATQAQKLSAAVYGDNKPMRDRAAAALEQLKNDSRVHTGKLGAIGYCFGGACALELARSGADLKGVVSFHGNLATANAADAKNIKGKILVCTGGDDSFVPPAQVQAFEDEMRSAGVDYQVNVYGGAHHAFSNPDADKFKIPNISYNASADRRSWEAMRSFFAETLGPTGK